MHEFLLFIEIQLNHNHIGKNNRPHESTEYDSENIEAGEKWTERPIESKYPPPGHYKWKRPKLLIDTDLESDHDPKEKQNREFWDKQNIFNVG